MKPYKKTKSENNIGAPLAPQKQTAVCHSQLAVPSRVDTKTEKEQVWLVSASKVIETNLSPSFTG